MRVCVCFPFFNFVKGKQIKWETGTGGGLNAGEETQIAGGGWGGGLMETEGDGWSGWKEGKKDLQPPCEFRLPGLVFSQNLFSFHPPHPLLLLHHHTPPPPFPAFSGCMSGAAISQIATAWDFQGGRKRKMKIK